jgi:acyl-CoA synthetase (AMP-forming)/AMP-acid ligase II
MTQPYPGSLGGKLNRISGCTGVLWPGVEALLLRDETGVPPANFSSPASAVGACTLNEPGELWLRSENVALGYWNNPKANAATFVHGWLRTGDRFRVDEVGYFWFADRAKVRSDFLSFSGSLFTCIGLS